MGVFIGAEGRRGGGGGGGEDQELLAKPITTRNARNASTTVPYDSASLEYNLALCFSTLHLFLPFLFFHHILIPLTRKEEEKK